MVLRPREDPNLIVLSPHTQYFHVSMSDLPENHAAAGLERRCWDTESQGDWVRAF